MTGSRRISRRERHQGEHVLDERGHPRTNAMLWIIRCTASRTRRSLQEDLRNRDAAHERDVVGDGVGKGFDSFPRPRLGAAPRGPFMDFRS